MARLFDDALSEKLIAASAVASGPPLTIAAWFNTDAVAGGAILGIGDSTDRFERTVLHTRSSGKLGATTVDGPGSSATSDSISDYSLNVWEHGCGVFASTSSRRCALNGIFSVEDTTLKTPSTPDRTFIGAQTNEIGAWNLFFSGRIAEAAIWNVVLTDDEVKILAAGYSPLCLTHRLGNLVMYQDLIRSIDRPGIGPNMTATGTMVSEHPRIIYPSGLRLGLPPITPKIGGPFCIETADVWTPTVVAGQGFFVGAKQGEAVSTGPTAGEVNC